MQSSTYSKEDLAGLNWPVLAKEIAEHVRQFRQLTVRQKWNIQVGGVEKFVLDNPDFVMQNILEPMAKLVLQHKVIDVLLKKNA